MTLKAVALSNSVPYSTARRWVRRYRRDGLVGLAYKRRLEKDIIVARRRLNDLHYWMRDAMNPKTETADYWTWIEAEGIL